MKSHSNVYITRSGSVSSLGNSFDEIKDSFFHSQSYFQRLPLNFLHQDIPIKFVSSIRGTPELNTQNYRKNFSKIANTTIKKLFSDWLPIEKLDLIIFCNNTGPNHEQYFSKENPFLENENFLQELKNKGQSLQESRVMQIVNTCASGTAAIEWSSRQIKNKIFSRVLIISYELTNHLYYNYQHFLSLGVLATPQENEKIELSYSKKRSGFIKADSMAYVLLESKEKCSNAPIAKVLGGYSESDCETISDGLSDGFAVERLIQKTLDLTNVEINQINFISGHGSGTISNDKDEIFGLEKVFSQSKRKPILHSLKSWVGHSLSSAALLEIDAILKMFQLNMALGNLHNSDPEATQHLILPRGCLFDYKLDVVLKTSFGFGGYNSALLLKNEINP